MSVKYVNCYICFCIFSLPLTKYFVSKIPIEMSWIVIVSLPVWTILQKIFQFIFTKNFYFETQQFRRWIVATTHLNISHRIMMNNAIFVFVLVFVSVIFKWNWPFHEMSSKYSKDMWLLWFKRIEVLKLKLKREKFVGGHQHLCHNQRYFVTNRIKCVELIISMRVGAYIYGCDTHCDQ